MNDRKKTERLGELIKVIKQLPEDQWSSAVDYLIDCARTHKPVIKSKPIGLSWIGCGIKSVPAGITVEDLEEEIRKLRGSGD